MRKAVRKTLALFFGVPIVILGLILIPLPGPGILLTFLGLFILSLEFEFAARHKNRMQNEIKKVVDQAKERASNIEGKK